MPWHTGHMHGCSTRARRPVHAHANLPSGISLCTANVLVPKLIMRGVSTCRRPALLPHPGAAALPVVPSGQPQHSTGTNRQDVKGNGRDTGVSCEGGRPGVPPSSQVMQAVV